MKGWKTLAFGLLLAIGVPALDYLGGVDFAALGLDPKWAALIGAVVMGLRAMTTSAIGRKMAIAALVLGGALSLSACGGATKTAGCALYDKLGWLLDVAHNQHAGKYAGSVRAVENAIAAGVCADGDLKVRGEAAAKRLVEDLWQMRL